MEEEKVPSKPADARIVRAVRKLKSNVNYSNNKLEENKEKSSKQDKKSLSRGNTINNINKDYKSVSNKNLNNNNKINDYKQRKPINKNLNNKILLDGSAKANDKVKVFDYETLKRYKKNRILFFKKIYYQMIILINIKKNL